MATPPKILTGKTRLFAGRMNGVNRVRLAIPGGDASDLDTRPRDLQFDTNWEQGLTIHKMGVIPKTQRDFPFEDLDYIPYVWVTPADKSGGILRTYLGFDYDCEGAKVTKNNVNLPSGRDKSSLVVVFRAPAAQAVKGDTVANPARLLIGFRGKKMGVFASREGYDVRTCTAGNLLFDSTAQLVHNPRGMGLVTAFMEGNDDPISVSGFYELKTYKPSFHPLFIPIGFDQGGKNMYWPPSRTVHNGDIEQAEIAGTVAVSKTPNGIGVSYNLKHRNFANTMDGKNLYYMVFVFDVPQP